jgi:hypothetical protein
MKLLSLGLAAASFNATAAADACTGNSTSLTQTDARLLELLLHTERVCCGILSVCVCVEATAGFQQTRAHLHPRALATPPVW